MPGRARVRLLSLLLTLSTAACSTGVAPSPGGTTPVPATGVITPSAGNSSRSPTDSVIPSEPVPTDTPVQTHSPDTSACSGKPDNQAFFATVAAGVKWDVYCAALPPGWFVQYGKYDLSNGGQLSVTYQGPSKTHFQILEGAYTCTPSDTVCEPRVDEVGPTLYGDRTGTLYTLNPGFAVYVNLGGQPPKWAAASVDLDESTFVQLVAKLRKVMP